MTSKAAKAKLLDVEENDPEFWAELTQRDKSNIATPGVVEGQPVPEDTEVGGTEEMFDDDSEVPTHAVVAHVLHGRLQSGVKLTKQGDLVSSVEAESTEINHDELKAKTEGNRMAKWAAESALNSPAPDILATNSGDIRSYSVVK